MLNDKKREERVVKMFGGLISLLDGCTKGERTKNEIVDIAISKLISYYLQDLMELSKSEKYRNYEEVFSLYSEMIEGFYKKLDIEEPKVFSILANLDNEEQRLSLYKYSQGMLLGEIQAEDGLESFKLYKFLLLLTYWISELNTGLKKKLKTEEEHFNIGLLIGALIFYGAKRTPTETAIADWLHISPAKAKQSYVLWMEAHKGYKNKHDFFVKSEVWSVLLDFEEVKKREFPNKHKGVYEAYKKLYDDSIKEKDKFYKTR